LKFSYLMAWQENRACRS